MRGNQAGHVPPPRVEGAMTLGGGRRVGFAEYGSPDGRPVVWFHGTPGARRQMPVPTRQAADERRVRIVVLERPGIGLSSGEPYGRVIDAATDAAECADRLGLDRFAVVGLSGGGPFALACAHQHPDRVVAAAVLGGVAPSRGPESIEGGLVQLASWLRVVVHPLQEPLGRGVWLGVRALRPVASEVFDLYARLSPPGDRAVFAAAGMKEMFVDDLVRGSRHHCGAFVNDVVLFTRHWGFHLSDITVPVVVWHGDADPIVPLAHGEHLAALVPSAALHVRRGESHLGGLAASAAVLDELLPHWH